MSLARWEADSQRVVGIGASAGGLDALKQLVAGLPLDSGLAFVILQHLPPKQIGKLAAILAPASTLPVTDAATAHRLQPNTVVVVPPHTAAKLYRGAITLRQVKGVRPTKPIDALFASLAETLGDRAVGIVLSGTGDDGTAGLRQILEAHGTTIVQDPATAQFDEMPRNAIAMGGAMFVVPPAMIGRELLALPHRAAKRTSRPANTGIERVLALLRDATGVDFTSYKRSTIERRVARRLAAVHVKTHDEYAAYLETHSEEASELYEDLLIHVTNLFRDGPVLEKAATLVVNKIAHDLPHDAPLRAWVPGCSTGEEVYSLAMLLAEQLGNHHFQLFGTDLSERAIDTARLGRYSEAIARQASEERIARFFHPDGDGYRINRDLRDRCVFVRHDLITDPPLSKMHLISCRNVLIYLEPELQKRVIPIFHYALEQPGYLVLGRSESIGGFENLFEPVDSEARIYTRKAAARSALALPIAGQLARTTMRRSSELARTALDIQRDIDHVLLARYAPAAVVVDDSLEVIQFRGRTGPYLEAPPGHPQLNVLRMAREGVRAELREALERSRRRDIAVRRERITLREGREKRVVSLEVIPVRGMAQGKRHFLIVFEEGAPLARRAAKVPAVRERGEIARVRSELDVTKEYLHAVLAEHMSTSEALGVANEELQSANEELQSSNEELETAKEELQSTNEELETVNSELQRGNELLRETNDDLVNVLSSVELAIIIVDGERRVRRFTPKARAVIQLIPSDIGRPIADLRVVVPELDHHISDVLASSSVHESTIVHPDGTSYRMQIRPYRSSDAQTSGAVITFIDVTELQSSVRAAHAARDQATAIVEAVPTPLAVIDDHIRLVSFNRSFAELFGGRTGDLLAIGQWRSPAVRQRLVAALAAGEGFDDLETEHTDGGRTRTFRLAARPLVGDHQLLVGIADITPLRDAESAREATRRERDAFLGAVSHELRTPLSTILLWAEALRGFSEDDPRRKDAIAAIIEAANGETQLVEDLLDLALSRTAGLTVVPEAVDATDVVRDVLARLAPSAEEKQLVLSTSLAPATELLADPRRLRQIVANLVGNAIKFTPHGGTIGVTLERRDGHVLLRVQDTGAGLAPDVLSHAFEPFWQADGSTTRPHGGLGIGLSLVRHLVDRHGGTIAVASAGDGQGSTFTVQFPTAAAKPDRSRQ